MSAASRARALREAEAVLSRRSAHDGSAPRPVHLRPVSAPVVRVAVLGLLVALPATWMVVVAGSVGPVGELLVPIAFVLVVAWALFAWNRRAVLVNNRAQAALLAGDLGDAASLSLEVLSRAVVSEQMLGYGLYRVGVASLRRGDWAEAAPLLHAGFEVERRRAPGVGGNLALVCAAEEALAVASTGEIERARVAFEEAFADPETAREPSALGRALAARTRAVLALRSGAPERALEVLAAERALLRNVLSADDAALVEAISTLARAKTADATAPTAVPVDDDTRAYVLRALPEAEAVLVAEV